MARGVTRAQQRERVSCGVANAKALESRAAWQRAQDGKGFARGGTLASHAAFASASETMAGLTRRCDTTRCVTGVPLVRT